MPPDSVVNRLLYKCIKIFSARLSHYPLVIVHKKMAVYFMLTIGIEMNLKMYTFPFSMSNMIKSSEIYFEIFKFFGV